MLGVLVNSAAIVAGVFLGMLFRNLISPEVSKSLRIALGFATVAIAIKMVLKFDHFLFMAGCVAGGGAIGTILELDRRLEGVGDYLKRRFGARGDSNFAYAFSMSSILFCTGAMAVLGSIQSGVLGNHEVLFAKATIDGVFSITLGSLYGLGAAFSAVTVFVYQGAIALLSPKLGFLAEAKILDEISGVGGVLLMMIGMNVAEISTIQVGNFFPAMILALLLAPWFLH